MTPSRVVWAPALLVCAASTLAHAEPAPVTRPPVVLVVDPCVDADAAEVKRIVVVELDARVVPEAEAEATQVRAGCEGLLVRVDVLDPVTRKTLSRLINVQSAIPLARSRLLALAVAELVSASWIELFTNPTPKVAPAGQPPSEEVRAAALRSVQSRTNVDGHVPGDSPGPEHTSVAPHTTFGPSQEVLVERRSVPVPVPAGVVGGEPTMPAGERVSRWRVEGLFEARALPASGLAAIGLGASLSFRRKGGLILRVDVLADHAQKDVSLGSVAVDSLSTGPTLMLELHRGAFAVAGGAGVRIGVADLTGRPSDVLQARGASFVSVWGGPFVDAEVEVRVARGVAVVAGGELGDVPFPTRATVVAPGGGTVSIVGVWFGAYGGLALSF